MSVENIRYITSEDITRFCNYIEKVFWSNDMAAQVAIFNINDSINPGEPSSRQEILFANNLSIMERQLANIEEDNPDTDLDNVQAKLLDATHYHTLTNIFSVSEQEEDLTLAEAMHDLNDKGPPNHYSSLFH